jgi:hypothetical protein
MISLRILTWARVSIGRDHKLFSLAIYSAAASDLLPRANAGKRKRGKKQAGEEEEEMEEEGAKQSEAGKEGDKEKDGEEEAPAKKQKKKLEITQDEYSEMTHMIVRELRRREDADEENMPNQVCTHVMSPKSKAVVNSSTQITLCMR